MSANRSVGRFVHLVGSYHGDTAGAMSVSDIALFKQRFGALIVETLAYDSIADALARDDVAAIIVEPIVQAAAGMRIVPEAMYGPLRDSPSPPRTSRAPQHGSPPPQHGSSTTIRDSISPIYGSNSPVHDSPLPLRGSRTPLLIVDEIATGFGRTGTLFAFEQLELEPDIIALGKGLTGGTLALSATLTTDRVYDAFLGEYADVRHLFHGHSYAANPIACAAALASLELFQTEGTLEHVARTDAALDALLAPLRNHALVVDVRRAGLMIGVEIDNSRIAADGAVTPAWRIANDLYERGHFTRPIGATIQLVPPLSSTLDELQSFIDALLAALDAATT